MKGNSGGIAIKNFNTMDINRDGQLSLEEFERIFFSTEQYLKMKNQEAHQEMILLKGEIDDEDEKIDDILEFKEDSPNDYIAEKNAAYGILEFRIKALNELAKPLTVVLWMDNKSSDYKLSNIEPVANAQR